MERSHTLSILKVAIACLCAVIFYYLCPPVSAFLDGFPPLTGIIILSATFSLAIIVLESAIQRIISRRISVPREILLSEENLRLGSPIPEEALYLRRIFVSELRDKEGEKGEESEEESIQFEFEVT